MNSKSLQAKFPEIYREFFSKCPIVVSVPTNFFWSGEYSVLYGGLGIKQSLPLRIYVGLEPLNLSGFAIGESFVFAPSHSCFESGVMPVNERDKIIKFLNQDLRNPWRNINSGFKINVLSEVPMDCGLNPLGGTSHVALATAVALSSGSISSEAISRWNQLPICQLSSDKDFDQIFRTARKIEFLTQGGFASGASCFVPLVHSVYPIIYFTEKQTTATLPDLDIIDQKKYLGFRIDELINLRGKDSLDLGALPGWPVDFGLIFSGDIRHAESTLKSVKEREQHLNVLSFEWRKILSRLELSEDKILFSEIIKNPRLKMGEPYLNALTTVGLEIFYGLTRILGYGSSREAVQNFLQLINCTHRLLTPLFSPSPMSDEICFLVDRYVRDFGDDFGAGCKLVVEKRADILFVVNSHALRNRIFELIAYLQKETKRNIRLDYASWIDGFEEEGVKIEQHIAEGIYSRFISEGAISLKNFTKEGNIQAEITSLEDFEKEKGKIDLLLDAMENNVYVRGEKLSSKEIPSSSATVEILSILLDNLGKSIPNTQLPESSYSKDRNEMQSKIISPLVKIIKAKTGKSLSLKISGGLVEFKIKLDPSNLDIRILNKVF